eukprot:m51a1_g2148 hypothetical protein (529) ;mRNA; f:9768-11474
MKRGQRSIRDFLSASPKTRQEPARPETTSRFFARAAEPPSPDEGPAESPRPCSPPRCADPQPSQAPSDEAESQYERMRKLGIQELSAAPAAAATPSRKRQRQPSASDAPTPRRSTPSVVSRYNLRRVSGAASPAPGDGSAGSAGASAARERVDEAPSVVEPRRVAPVLRPELKTAFLALPACGGPDLRAPWAPGARLSSLAATPALLVGTRRPFAAAFDDGSGQRTRRLLTAGSSGIASIVELYERPDGGDGDGAPAATSSVAWKAHRGWIGGVAWAGGRVLSSANDGVVRVWSVGDDLSVLPVQLAEKRAGAIPFSMCARDGISAFALACKNGSVVLGTVAEASVVVEGAYEAHDQVAVCVRYRRQPGACVVASGSRDASVCVSDSRQRGVALRIDGAHAGGVFSVDWRPGCEHELATSGPDATIAVWDLRSAGAGRELRRMAGHGVANARAIHRAAYCGAGTAIVSGGAETNELSVYDADSGAPLSRVHVGFEPTCVEGLGVDTALLAVAAPDGGISLYTPMTTIN